MNAVLFRALQSFNDPSFYEDNGYTNVRIPGIVSLPNGTLCCCYECRRGGDWSAIDIGIQFSRDGGLTWSPTQIVVSGKGRNAMNNPVLLSHGDELYLFWCENYKRLFYAVSRDSGFTFSHTVELTQKVDELLKGRFWSVIAIGPGHGILSAEGSFLLPVWFGFNRADMFAHHPSFAAVLRGQAGGERWQIGNPFGAPALEDPSEACIAQGSLGAVYCSIRNENSEKQRAVAVSRDDGKSWSAPVLLPAFPDPTCAAGLCRAGDGFLFVNCESARARENLTVKMLDADFCPVDSFLISKNGGYSDVCFCPAHKRAVVIYENGSGHLQIAGLSLE